MQVRSQFRKIFVAMGFEEMMTNAYVENRCASRPRLCLVAQVVVCLCAIILHKTVMRGSVLLLRVVLLFLAGCGFDLVATGSSNQY